MKPDEEKRIKRFVEELLHEKRIITDVGKKVCPIMSWKQPSIIYCVKNQCMAWKDNKCGLIK